MLVICFEISLSQLISQVSTGIHEITHSWFGNDVGCKNWEHFWINEGLNTFMERKALGLVKGDDVAKIAFFNGNITLVNTMEDYGLDDSYSSLNPQIGDDDPENSFSYVPYEKGAQFVLYLETLLGEEMMKTMLKGYLSYFSQQAIDEAEFRVYYEDFVNTNFDEAAATDILSKTMWDEWVKGPGLIPSVAMFDFSTAEQTAAKSLAEEYVVLGATPESVAIFDDFISAQRVTFVKTLAESEGTTTELMGIIDADLDLTNTPDPKAKNPWFVMGITLGYDAVLPATRAWMSEQGRSAYVRPVFTALVNAGMCETAEEWFAENEDFYNIYVANGVRRTLEACEEDVESPVDAPVDGEDDSAMVASVVGLLASAMIL